MPPPARSCARQGWGQPFSRVLVKADNLAGCCSRGGRRQSPCRKRRSRPPHVVDGDHSCLARSQTPLFAFCSHFGPGPLAKTKNTRLPGLPSFPPREPDNASIAKSSPRPHQLALHQRSFIPRGDRVESLSAPRLSDNLARPRSERPKYVWSD